MKKKKFPRTRYLTFFSLVVLSFSIVTGWFPAAKLLAAMIIILKYFSSSFYIFSSSFCIYSLHFSYQLSTLPAVTPPHALYVWTLKPSCHLINKSLPAPTTRSRLIRNNFDVNCYRHGLFMNDNHENAMIYWLRPRHFESNLNSRWTFLRFIFSFHATIVCSELLRTAVSRGRDYLKVNVDDVKLTW